ncbi:MAG TPA: hypothetical protein PLR83_00335 [Pyrinomonadaceae bacterium]|nr:hypothetical protein [Pyrinomonadaceae bacterium]
MGRRSTVEKLLDEQFDFVIRQILDGRTDREISAAFEDRYGEALPKSSLNTWRNSAGNELAERYRLKRFQVRSFVEQLKSEGVDVAEDHYSMIIQSLEDHLLTAERDLVANDPLKLLAARQEDERLKIKREQIALNRQKLDFEKEKHEREAAVRVDRLAIGASVLKFFLFWLNDNEPHVADVVTRRGGAIAEALEGFIEEMP